MRFRDTVGGWAADPDQSWRPDSRVAPRLDKRTALNAIILQRFGCCCLLLFPVQSLLGCVGKFGQLTD